MHRTYPATFSDDLLANYDRPDISNPSKFRRLKRHALHAHVSGLVKARDMFAFSYANRTDSWTSEDRKAGGARVRGEQGLHFDFSGERAWCVDQVHILHLISHRPGHTLSGLRYLQFQHVDTQPLESDTLGSLLQSKVGLHEVIDMRALVDALDAIGLKTWFRTQMEMDKGP
ncbi:hypothetical protein DXG03_005806 [Asterophora parasitica]|uniref:Uncharacterized protein n=1 Tax=Asterophora parasitica TaxID=117018 RepID=A0A9P7G941_9AGAR|nr:hypothetical protein DXG03_005806 [Asterophora parasitica]